MKKKDEKKVKTEKAEEVVSSQVEAVEGEALEEIKSAPDENVVANEDAVEGTPGGDAVVGENETEGVSNETVVVNEDEVGDMVSSMGKLDENLKSKTIKQTGEKGWYVIHSYAGYEDQVAENLKQRIETLHMKDKIFNVLVPKEKQIEIKNGKRRTVERRIFPGYVMVEMIVTDDSWYVVRNTPNVTGFIGMGVRPTPMLPDEVDRIMKRMGVQESKYKIEVDVDDLVKIVDGPLKGFEGKVTEVDEDKGKVKVSVNMFGRETPVNLDSLQVKKI